MTLIEHIPTSVFSGGDEWVIYEATLHFTGRLIGGAPSDPQLVEGWLKKNLGFTDEEMLKTWTKRHLTEVQGLDPADVNDAALEKAIEENAIEKKAQVFKRTPDGKPYIEGRHLKAMLKEATSIAYPDGEHKWGQYRAGSRSKYAGQMVGGKDPRSVVAERVWVPEQPFVIADDTDGFDLAVGHIRDWKGTRSAIGYYEYVTQPVFSISLQVLDDFLDPEQWERIWRVAERNGLGARRSQGAGQFVVVAWERL
jgi:hypothetical protein